MSLLLRFRSREPQWRQTARAMMPRMSSRQRGTNPMSGPDLSIEASPEPGQARRGGRAGKRRGAASAFEQPPFRQLTIPFQPTEIVSADELEAIHLAALRGLDGIGLQRLHDQAGASIEAPGAEVPEG